MAPGPGWDWQVGHGETSWVDLAERARAAPSMALARAVLTSPGLPSQAAPGCAGAGHVGGVTARGRV